MNFFRKPKKLFQKKDNFFAIYKRQVMYTVQASSALRAMMSTEDPAEWRRLEKEVKECEIHGDAMLSEFYDQLYHKMMSPMRRSDFQHIAMDMDEFMDQINSCAKSLLLYLPKRIDQQIMDMAQYIEAEADALRTLVSCLDDIEKNFSSITLQCDRITELEHAADDSYEEYIGQIFREEKDAIEVMKYKNIAETLEATTDAAKKISDRIRNLLFRYC